MRNFLNWLRRLNSLRTWYQRLITWERNVHGLMALIHSSGFVVLDTELFEVNQYNLMTEAELSLGSKPISSSAVLPLAFDRRS